MKRLTTVFCMLIAIVVSVQLIKVREVSKPEIEAIEVAEKYDKMYFSTTYVNDSVSYGQGEEAVYYMIYDDPDAGMFYEAVRVTKDTYATITNALKKGDKLCGFLNAVCTYEATEYELDVMNI